MENDLYVIPYNTYSRSILESFNQQILDENYVEFDPSSVRTLKDFKAALRLGLTTLNVGFSIVKCTENRDSYICDIIVHNTKFQIIEVNKQFLFAQNIADFLVEISDSLKLKSYPGYTTLNASEDLDFMLSLDRKDLDSLYRSNFPMFPEYIDGENPFSMYSNVTLTSSTPVDFEKVMSHFHSLLLIKFGDLETVLYPNKVKLLTHDTSNRYTILVNDGYYDFVSSTDNVVSVVPAYIGTFFIKSILSTHQVEVSVRKKDSSRDVPMSREEALKLLEYI